MISRLLIPVTLTFAANASVLTYTYTVTGTLLDGPVSARAILTLDTTAQNLDIVLANLLANPVADGQLVSELFIGSLAGSPVLASSSAAQGTPPGSNVSARPGGTGWGFGASAGGYELCISCPGSVHPPGKTAPPRLLIIGPPDSNGQYSNANSSIYVHSPYLFEEAFFHLTGVTNVPANADAPPFSVLKIGFGSHAIQLTAGDPGIVHTTAEAAVPEPGGWLLATGGLMMICVGRRQTQRSRRVRALAGRKE